MQDNHEISYEHVYITQKPGTSLSIRCAETDEEYSKDNELGRDLGYKELIHFKVPFDELDKVIRLCEAFKEGDLSLEQLIGCVEKVIV